MGITISHKLSQKKIAVKSTLDRAEQLAKHYQQQAKTIDVPFSIRRESDNYLYIDIGNCETLSFAFKSVKQIYEEKEKTGWSFLWSMLSDDGKNKIDAGYEIEKYPQNEIYYCSSFCKTQFAKTLSEHRFVAEIIRCVASYCLTADVNDEGDYYNTGDITNAQKAIKSNGKLIESIAGTLKNSGWKEDEIITSKTNIK